MVICKPFSLYLSFSSPRFPAILPFALVFLQFECVTIVVPTKTKSFQTVCNNRRRRTVGGRKGEREERERYRWHIPTNYLIEMTKNFPKHVVHSDFVYRSDFVTNIFPSN